MDKYCQHFECLTFVTPDTSMTIAFCLHRDETSVAIFTMDGFSDR